jgi:hypothetical protein
MDFAAGGNKSRDDAPIDQFPGVNAAFVRDQGRGRLEVVGCESRFMERPGKLQGVPTYLKSVNIESCSIVGCSTQIESIRKA